MAAGRDPGTRPGELLQTLQRGISVLDLLAEHPSGLTIAELADLLGVHRTIASRLLATLASNRLIVRDAAGRCLLGPRVTRYAASVVPHLREVAAGELRRLSDLYGVTAVLQIADGDEAWILDVAEPLGIGYFVGVRVGNRHPLPVGAGGIAILAGRAPASDDPLAVRRARKLGYATTQGELNPGVAAFFVPIGLEPTWAEASIGVLALHPLDGAVVGSEVIASAATIRARLSDSPDLS